MNRIGYTRQGTAPMQNYLIYRTKRADGLIKARGYRENPFYLRILERYHATRMGKLSKWIADTTHFKTVEAW